MYTMTYNFILIVLIFFTIYKILIDLISESESYQSGINGVCKSCGSYGSYTLYDSNKSRGLHKPIMLFEPYDNDNKNIGTIQNISYVQPILQNNEIMQTNDSKNNGAKILDLKSVSDEIQKINNILNKLYQSDLDGNYLTHGWFVEFHNIIDHPKGIILGESLGKIHSAPNICFRTKESFPFLGSPENPIYFPKADNIGIRAITVLKIPKTGFYDFRILSDDGLRFYYQKVSANVILNEKNARSQWIMVIDAWVTQAENWKLSKKIFFNQNELILLRMDYYEMGIFATACIKIRYYLDNDQVQESDLPFENTFCSLLWSEVPLLGVP